jgi:hypothetical protein
MCTRERTNEEKKLDDNRQRKHGKENVNKIETNECMSKITEPYLIRTTRKIMA